MSSSAVENNEFIATQNSKLDMHNDFIMNFDVKEDQKDRTKVSNLQEKLRDIDVK
ncbi:MAG: hypothetical protein PF487_07120 [Bacteroidales bacterium]|jgi:hypothetical protein|nr:hypothetical protein [Bacteroidales bacterium]